MASLQNKLMTFEEFATLPESGLRQELHHGELFEMPPAKRGHKRIQAKMMLLLNSVAPKDGGVETEFEFRPLPQFEYWIADVAYFDRNRESRVPADGYFDGSPEVVIEVLSPSNSLREMRERRKICLENGSIEFWIVDDVERTVEVSTRDLRSIVYKSGEQVPLFFAPGNTLAVDSIFE